MSTAAIEYHRRHMEERAARETKFLASLAGKTVSACKRTGETITLSFTDGTRLVVDSSESIWVDDGNENHLEGVTA